MHIAPLLAADAEPNLFAGSILHGEGDHRATVSVMSRPGVYDPAEARLIRINPEKRQFIADGARGFWTSQ